MGALKRGRLIISFSIILSMFIGLPLVGLEFHVDLGFSLGNSLTIFLQVAALRPTGSDIYFSLKFRLCPVSIGLYLY